MNRPSPRPWLPLLAVLVIAAACSSTPATSPTLSPAGSASTSSEPSSTAIPTGSAAAPPTSTAAAPSAPPAATAFDAVIAMLGPQGDISPEMALEAFALAVAPLPGVTPPAGAPGHLDADMAVAWVSQVWDQLSAPQRTAIDNALGAMPDPYGNRSAASASAAKFRLAAWQPVTAAAERECGLFLADPADAPTGIPPAVEPYADMMKAAAGSIAGHLHRPSLSKLAVCLAPTGVLSGPALTRVFDAESARVGLPASCSIYLNADSIGGVDDGDLGYLMAFETFLCFQRTADPTETLASSSTRKIPAWVIGGTAAWAGANVATELFGGAGDRLAEVWVAYLTEPQVGLSRRTIDAIGFFAQVDQNQPTAWDVLDDTLLGADSLDAFYAATGRRQSFIDLWAAGFFRDASRGADWDITGPGIPTDTPEAGSIEVANGESEEMAAPAMAVSTADLSTSADITNIAGNHLRVHDGVQDLKDVRNQAYCTRDGGGDACACPKGSPGAGRPPLPRLNVEAKLALTGMEFSGTATIRGISLEEYCGPQPTPEPDGQLWSMIFWSPDLGESYPPLLVAYTCNGLKSTWKAIYLPSIDGLTRTFEMPFDVDPVAHLDIHRHIPAAGTSGALDLDYSVDFELDATADPPVIKVTGTKTETQGGQTWVFPPREFGSDAPLPLRSVSLETQLKSHPEYQHPFRAQALEECGG